MTGERPALHTEGRPSLVRPRCAGGTLYLLVTTLYVPAGDFFIFI